MRRNPPGAGRAKLRLSQGFPRRTRLERQSFESPQSAQPFSLTQKIAQELWGMILVGEAKREAPVRTEPHPT